MKSFLITAYLGLLSTPVLLFAQTFSGDTGESARLVNPLGEDSDLPGFLQELLNVLMIFAVPLIVFMIIYAGFLYVTARGNETQVSQASKALLYAVIGGVIILGANIILTVISGTVDAFR